mgnify:FL=1
MDINSIAVIDIEAITAPWWKEVEEEAALKFPPLPSWLPCVIGCWAVDLPKGGSLSYASHTAYGEPGDISWEKAALVDVGEVIQTSDIVVTFNGRSYDMPLLQLRALATATPWAFWERYKQRYPNYYNPLLHIDLAEMLTDYGAGTRFKLDYLIKMVDEHSTSHIAGKGDMDGSKVEETWQQPGGPEKVKAYCDDDVKRTLQLYIRWMYIHGDASKEDVKRWVLQLDEV